MDLSYHARKKFANTLAKNNGLTLVEEAVNMPRTDGKTIYTPIYRSDWEEDSPEYTQWWCSFIHEIYHNIHPEDFDVMKKYNINMKSEFGLLHNLNLDHNIEYTEKGKFPGLDRLNMKGSADILPPLFKKLREVKNHNPTLEGLFVFDGIIRSKWNRYITNIEKLTEGLSEETNEVLSKLYPFADEWERTKSAEENYDLSKRIAEVLDLSNESPQSSEDGESGNEGEESDGEKDEKDEEAKEGIVDYLDLLNHEHDESGTSGKGKLKVDYSKWEKYSGWKSGKFEIANPMDFYPVKSFALEINELSYGNTLADDMREWLQVLTENRTEVGHKYGRIHSGSLWKNKVYGWESEQGSSIFSQETYEEAIDTAVLILVDASASMYSGRKFIHAAKSATILSDTFRELDIPLAIHSFTDHSKCVHYIHKDFHDDMSADQVVDSFARVYGDMHSNADGDNIQYAASELLQRKEQKKILIVLSDGQPAATSGVGDIYGWTRNVVQEIEEDGEIEIYGIGIMDASVESIYTNNKVIKQADQIEPTLISLLQDHVLV